METQSQRKTTGTPTQRMLHSHLSHRASQHRSLSKNPPTHTHTHTRTYIHTYIHMSYTIRLMDAVHLQSTLQCVMFKNFLKPPPFVPTLCSTESMDIKKNNNSMFISESGIGFIGNTFVSLFTFHFKNSVTTASTQC